MRNLLPRLALILMLMVFGLSLVAEDHGYVPKGGFVSDEKTAVAVAEAILIPIYGEEQIKSERPFRATIGESGIWTVEGSLPNDEVGGVAVIKIARQDGRVIYVFHGK